MIISANNIGDVIVAYATGNRYQITDVTAHEVSYYKENSPINHSTTEFDFAGYIETDPFEKQSFFQNVNLCKILENALSSAKMKVAADEMPAQEMETARSVLSSSSQLQNHLDSRIALARQRRSEKIAPIFLTELMNVPEGTDMNFMGHNVSYLKDSLSFQIDDKIVPESSAVSSLLSLVHKDYSRSGLDGMIQDASARAKTDSNTQNTPHKNEPSL